MNRSIVRFVSASVFCSVASHGGAQELAPPLRKDDVEKLVVGKSIHYARTRDGVKIGWNFRSDDSVFYTTSATMRNLTVAGTYRITDAGAVCFKWNQDKSLTLPDACFRFRREGETLHVVSAKDPDNVVGDVVPE